MTLHIYSRPFDICAVYDFRSRNCQGATLVNTSAYGVLKPDLKGEEATLIH